MSFPGRAGKSGNFFYVHAREKVSENGGPTREGGLLTTRQVADFLSVSPATVLRRWRAGELPGIRLASNVLRFDPAELEAWLDERHGGCTGHTSRV